MELELAARHFARVRLPAHLRYKLARMPYDKGYIYQGVVFFGELPPQARDKSELVLFEPQQDRTTIIHEYTRRRYRELLWTHNDNKKVEIHSEPRQQRRKPPTPPKTTTRTTLPAPVDPNSYAARAAYVAVEEPVEETVEETVEEIDPKWVALGK